MKEIKILPQFAKYLENDVNRSRLAVVLNANRRTLDRWISSTPDKLARYDRVLKIRDLTGLKIAELFIFVDSIDELNK